MSSKPVDTVNKLQDLVDSFDDIPKIMSKINFSLNDSPTRFKVILPNSSNSVELSLRGNNKVKVTDPNCESKKLERMANQAMKVLNQLSKIAPKKNKRSIKDTSSITENKLKYLINNSGINIEKLYFQYDTNKTGKVSYKDFTDTLVNLSSGIDRQEAQELATSLDHSNIGAIEYKNILKSLQDIQHKEVQSSENINQITNKSKVIDAKKPLTIEPKQTFEYISLTNNDIISIHDLSPNHRIDTQHGSSNSNSNIPRRYYYNPVINKDLYPDKSSTTNQSTPYYIELSKADARKQSAKNRSRSAPVRSSRSQGIKLNSEKETKNPYKYSLTAKLLSNDTNENNNDNMKELNINISKEDINQIDLEINPFYKLTEKQNDIKQSDYILNTKILENSLVHQLQGNISTLKHLLKKDDPTSSGIVTYPEFKNVLLKAGVNFTTKQIHHLYSSLSDNTLTNKDSASSTSNSTTSNHHTNNTSSYKSAHTNDKGISIESFVDRVLARSTSEDFKHIQQYHNNKSNHTYTSSSNQDYSFSDKTKKQQVATIMKKVLHAKSKLVYPNHTYDYIDVKQHGRLDYSQLQDALHHMNANLTPQEYSVLYENIPKTYQNGTELVEIDTFHDALLQNVNAYEEINNNILNEQRLQQKRYSNSYKSSNDFQLTHQSIEYDPLCHNKKTYNDTLKNTQRWNSICNMLRNQPTPILYAFSKQNNQNTSSDDILMPTSSQLNDFERGVSKQDITDINIKDIRKNLCNVGINLGETDYIQLMNHLQIPSQSNLLSSDDTNVTNNQQSISLEKFCETVNIPLSITNKNKIVVSKPKEMDEYGIFTSSLKSLGSDNNYSSSYCMDSLTAKEKNASRRVSLGTALLQYPPQEPSRFWDLTKSSDALFPSPMPSLRETYLPGQQPYSTTNDDATTSTATSMIDNISAMKGLIKLNGMVSHSLSEHISNTNAERIIRSRSKIHVENFQSQTKSVKRSISAPPRFFSNIHNHSSQMMFVLEGEPQQLQQGLDLKSNMNIKTNDTTIKKFYQNHLHNDLGSPYLSKLNTAASVARWASSSLADYFEKREMIRNNTPNEINSSVDTNSNTFNTTGTPSNKQLSSLRKIFVNQQHNTTSSSRDGNAGYSIHSQAPFATD